MKYRILSLDGGGSWALIQVKALIALYNEKTTGHAVLRDFDMVAANSGGSIVLGGLVEDLALGDLLALFQEQQQRQAIFSPTKSWGDRALHDLTGMGPKYSAAAKLVALHNALPKRGNVPLTSAASGLQRPGAAQGIHLLITGFDYDRNRACFFRSAAAGSGAMPDWGQGAAATVTLAEAIHASSNAPVNYFDAPAEFPGASGSGRYWDGAISGCNNPVLAAVTEAIVLRQDPKNIAALSIGTASVALPWPSSDQENSIYTQKLSSGGLVHDLAKLAGSILDDPPDIATFLAHTMTGGALDPTTRNGRIVRMNPLISPVKIEGKWTAPGGLTAAQFSYLANLAMDAVEQQEVDSIAKFADLWIQGKVLNQPVRMDADTLTAEIGQVSFQQAFSWWDNIK